MDMSTGGPAAASEGSPTTEVTVNGALEATAVADFAAVLDRAIAQRPRRVVIDLTDCPFIDAAAVDVLLDAHRRTWRSAGLLTLRNPSPRVRRILEIARVDHVLRLALIPPIDSVPGPSAEPVAMTRAAPGDRAAP
jgi:anti-anti-sigma factor